MVDVNGCQGCGCQPDPNDGGAPCTTDSDCALGTACGFPLADACLARGTCVAAQAVTCQAYAPGCGCDGNPVNTACTGLPAGFVHHPVLKVGACAATTDAGSDAGECCPTTSNAYSCAFPDGGSGIACHDPRLGCASSTVCGAGCDRLTRGPCGP